MQDFERRKIQAAIDCIEICMTELRVQVLNNIDAQMDEGKPDRNAVKVFVKQPILKTVDRLLAQKMNLMKVLRDQERPQIPLATPTALKEA